MRWTVHGERALYESPWVSLGLADVEIPGHRRFEHHVVRLPQHAAGTVVLAADRSAVLLLWRHRFITDSWGFEVPAGRIEPGEQPAQAAAREVLEETGWRPGPLRQLLRYHPSNGLSDQVFHLFVADGATHLGPPSDATESERVEWVPLDRVHAALRDGQVPDGLTLTALLYAQAFPDI